MKTFVCTGYGAPDVLQQKEKPTPDPNENELLVRVHATVVNSGDCRIRRADPFAVRFIFGWRKPRRAILGTIFSGTVERVGTGVTRFRPGDEIYGSTGMAFGAYATYLCLPDTAVAHLKPDNLSHEQAASLPFGGLTALHFFRKLDLRSGQRVLINGASGAVGSAFVQLARNEGIHVTAICSTKNHALVRSLGAHEMIDYTARNFSIANNNYDIVIDTVNKLSLRSCLDALNPTGTLVLSAAGMTEMIGALFRSAGKRPILMGVCKETQQHLAILSDLSQKGLFVPVIDRVMPFEQIPQAHAYVDKGHKAGNIVIRMP